MNVLLTSVGRRSYLVHYFKNALKNKGKVIAVNSEALTSGMMVADKSYVVPKVNSVDYISKLLDICYKENIKLVVSLFDIDLPFLAKSREEFEKKGISIAIADPWAIEIANDKWKTYEFLTNNKILTPKSYFSLQKAKDELKNKQINFPLIIKPRWGMGSLSIFKVEDLNELDFFYNYAKKEIQKTYLNILTNGEVDKSVIIQEFITGKEYNLDVFNDLDCNYFQTITKEKIAMRSGETDIAKIVENKDLVILGEKLSELFKHRGNMDVDVLQSLDGQFYVLEMNMRFGGGYPFSHQAGANFPELLISAVNGEKLKANKINIGYIGFKSINIISSNVDSLCH